MCWEAALSSDRAAFYKLPAELESMRFKFAGGCFRGTSPHMNVRRLGNMKKKLLALILTGALALSLGASGGEQV